MKTADTSLKRGAPLWLLVLINFSGTLAMHMFVPALPSAAHDLDASIAAMQMTISLYIVGLALGQLIYGPLSDCFGRRPMLIVGLSLYTVSGVAAALAPEAHMLIAARLFQALGGCAGLVLARAIVRDTTKSTEAVRQLALMNLITVVGPGVGPLIGAMLSENLGWRSIFVLLAALGVTNIACSWIRLPETGRPTGKLDATSLGHGYKNLLASPRFLGFAVGGGCATTSMYAFTAAAPFVFVNQLHRPLHEAGLYLGVLAIGVSLGNAITSRLIGRVSIERLMVRANAISVLAAFAFLATVLLGQLTVALTVIYMFLFTLGSGMSSPVALTKAVSVDAKLIGSAAGLYGFIQMTVGALATSFAGLGGNPALAAAGVLALAGVIAQLAFWVALRHEGAGRSDLASPGLDG